MIGSRVLSGPGVRASGTTASGWLRRGRSLALAVGIACAGCAPAGSHGAPGRRTPLLLVGIDGLEWSVIGPLLEAGELPTLRGWLDSGQGGYLESRKPTRSPAIWTTVATGKPPREHGILHFVHRDENDSLVLYTARDRKTAALWNMASALGVSTAVIGWWMTWPVEPVEGVMVAQTNTLPGDGASGGVWKGSVLEGVPGQVWPPERTREVLEIVRDAERHFDDTARSIFGAIPGDLSPLEATLWEGTRWSLRADIVYLEMARRLLAERRYELVMVYLGGADVIGHRFWRYRRPSQFADPPDEAERAILGDLIDDYYRHLDRALGELTAGLQGWNVVVLSDHGMRAFHTDAVFETGDSTRIRNSAHHTDAPPGVLVAAGPGIRRPARARWMPGDPLDQLPHLGTVLDVAPTVLTLLGLPVAEDLRGRVLTALLTLERTPLPTIASYDAFARPGQEGEVPRNPFEQERLRQLRALGYIGRR